MDFEEKKLNYDYTDHLEDASYELPIGNNKIFFLFFFKKKYNI